MVNVAPQAGNASLNAVSVVDDDPSEKRDAVQETESDHLSKSNRFFERIDWSTPSLCKFLRLSVGALSGCKSL